jgi:hypothetical protein
MKLPLALSVCLIAYLVSRVNQLGGQLGRVHHAGAAGSRAWIGPGCARMHRLGGIFVVCGYEPMRAPRRTRSDARLRANKGRVQYVLQEPASEAVAETSGAPALRGNTAISGPGTGERLEPVMGIEPINETCDIKALCEA